MNPGRTAVHNVSNIGYLRTKVEERADDTRHDYRKMVKT